MDADTKMLNIEEAKKCCLEFVTRDYDLKEQDDHVEIVDIKTIEVSAGWIFFYNSAKFLRTRDFGSMLMGNKPVFVHRNTGSAEYLQMAGSIEDVVNTLGGRIADAPSAPSGVRNPIS